jgi:excinuclease UvrABC nuclease subunit
LSKLMPLMIVFAVALVAAVPSAGPSNGTSVTVTARIRDLSHRVAILEHRVERQADVLDQTLDRAERVEGELRARIRELQEELSHHPM